MNKSNKIILLSLLFILSVFISGCAGGSTVKQGPKAVKQVKEVKLNWPGSEGKMDYYQYTTTNGVTMMFVPYKSKEQTEVFPRLNSQYPGYGYPEKADWQMVNNKDSGLLYIFKTKEQNRPFVYNNKALGFVEVFDPDGKYKNTNKAFPGIPPSIWYYHADMDYAVAKGESYDDDRNKMKYIVGGPAYTHVWGFAFQGPWAYPNYEGSQALYHYVEHFSSMSKQNVEIWHAAVLKRFPLVEEKYSPDMLPPTQYSGDWLWQQRDQLMKDRELLKELQSRKTLNFWGMVPVINQNQTNWVLLFTEKNYSSVADSAQGGAVTALLNNDNKWAVLDLTRSNYQWHDGGHGGGYFTKVQ